MPPPSPEFRLVCAACRWPRGEARDAAVRAAAAAEGIDWSRVVRIARRQRVGGLLADGIASAGVAVPDPAIAAALREQARHLAERNLFSVAEVVRLGTLFDRDGIDWYCFKGMPLAAEAYGTLSVKTSIDIDLLVPPADAARACALLREAGYRRFSPGPDIADEAVPAWMALCKESGWMHPERQNIVELHARLLANDSLLPDAGQAAPHRRVELQRGIAVPTMRADLVFPYLAAHGAHHGWFRLKWLADIAALLTARGTGAIEGEYRAAQAAGVGRCAAQALLLAHDLLALPLPPALERELRASPVHRLLVRIAMRSMAGSYEAQEHGGPAARSMLPATLGNLLLRRGLRYKWREIASLAANPVDRVQQRLPRGLGFLYPVLGGLRWSGRVIGLIGHESPARGVKETG